MSGAAFSGKLHKYSEKIFSAAEVMRYVRSNLMTCGRSHGEGKHDMI
jgi:hypothetical protein